MIRGNRVALVSPSGSFLTYARFPTGLLRDTAYGKSRFVWADRGILLLMDYGNNIYDGIVITMTDVKDVQVPLHYVTI